MDGRFAPHETIDLMCDRTLPKPLNQWVEEQPEMKILVANTLTTMLRLTRYNHRRISVRNNQNEDPEINGD